MDKMKQGKLVVVFVLIFVAACQAPTPSAPIVLTDLPASITPTPIPTSSSPSPVADRTYRHTLICELDVSSWLGPETIIISPDRKRVAYLVSVGEKQVVVVDGIQQKQYDSIGKGTLIFSPDSQRVAFAAVAGNKQFVVVDGVEEKHYDGISPDTLIISPDSQRVAYVANLDNKQFVVVDGKEEQHYDNIGANTLTFSPDSQSGLSSWMVKRRSDTIASPTSTLAQTANDWLMWLKWGICSLRSLMGGRRSNTL
jgi:hypothetical protein